MKGLTHPHLVALLGVVDKLPKLLIVTELMEKGALWDLYHESPPLAAAEQHHAWATRLCLQVARGMLHLHGKGILHRDLKSQNVWINQSDVAKVGDFGMSRINSHKTMTMVGSPLWCAPEILKSEQYSFGADVYSFSIIVFEALQWTEPYMHMTVIEIMIAVTQQHERPEISPSVPDALRALICECWQPVAEMRPTFGSIVQRLEGCQHSQIPAASPQKRQRQKQKQHAARHAERVRNIE